MEHMDGQKKREDLKKRNIKNFIILLIVALLIVASFAYLSNRERAADEEVEKLTAVQEVLARDLSSNYPPTPKEVLKYYSEITRCFYSEEYSDEELVKLAEKSRELFDEQLQANQTEEEYIGDLKNEIAIFKDAGRSISSYSVAGSANVDYYRYEGAEWAKLNCIYSMRTEGKVKPTQEEFLLRKDADGHWKIFGWKLVKEEANE